MLRRLGYGLLIVFVLLGAASVGGYFWAKSQLWSKIQKIAREHGAELEQPVLQIGWRGGLRFHVLMTGLKGQLKVPLPVTGTFVLPLFEVEGELSEDYQTVTFYDLKIQDLSGNFTMLSDGKSAEPVPEPKDEIEIPKLEMPTIDRPELPLAIDLQRFEITTAQILFLLKSPDSEISADMAGYRIDGSAALAKDLTNFNLAIESKEIKASQKAPGQVADAVVKSMKFAFASKSQREAPLKIAPTGQGKIIWSKWSFQKTPLKEANPPTAPLEVADQGGEMNFKADGDQFELTATGRKLTATPLKKPTDWKVDVAPLSQTQSERRYRLAASVPGLFDLDSQIEIPATFNPDHPEAQVTGRVSVHSDVSLLFLDKNPSPWKSQLGGPFDVRISRGGDLSLKTQLTGDGVTLALQTELNPRTQEVQASGFVSLNFMDKDFSYAGIKPSGTMSAPFKLLLRQKQKFFFESELRLRAFSVSTPDLKIESLQGSLPVKQAWAYQDGRWQLSPRLSANAFGRADFDSFEPLETRLNQLRIARIEFQKKFYGPVILDLKFEQNLLRSGSWTAVVGEGQIEGALQADLSLDNPRMGLLMRAFDVKLEDLLPPTILEAQQKSERGLSFRLGMDWDLGKATAVGRLDWSDINATQVLQLLDVMDPQFENATFNQARMVLAQAYPTRVQVELRGPVADVRISTNVMNLPEVRNVAISPYLVKANEALYSSEVYRRLRKPAQGKVKNLGAAR